MKIFCEKCKARVVVFRRIRKPGRFKGRLIIIADKSHSLCRRHQRSQFQSEMQKEKFAEPPPPNFNNGMRRRLGQIYSDY